jgi:hypothetical protein
MVDQARFSVDGLRVAFAGDIERDALGRRVA